jgi:hypothetical protein
MINVNQITSQLARMPDQALQKYAMLNKNDPYTVSLALSESNRRKAMREGAAPMPGQMPKVVDQDIAQMSPPPMQQMPPQQQMPQQARPQMPQQVQQQLPENTGIGQLPAQNMQGMADGGIVGYADRGLVYGGQYGGENLMPATTGYEGMGIVDFLRAMKNKISYNPLTPTQKSQTTYQSGIDVGGPGSSPMNTGRAPTADELRAAQLAATGNIPMGNTVTFTPQGGPAPAGGTPTGGAPTPLSRPSAGPAAPAGGITALPSEADTIKRFKDALGTSAEPTLKKGDFLKELSDISQPAYNKANAMVEKEKGRLKEGKEQDFYMALIEGGLAAASESSPNALQNIAKGFSKGAGSYREGLKDFRKAAQENAKMELELSRAEAADKKGDLKSYYDHQEKAMDRQARKDDRVAAGISAIINTTTAGQFDIARAKVSGEFGLQQARINKEGSIAASMAPLNLMTALGTAKPDSALRRGFDLQTLKAHAAALQETWSRQAYPNGNMGEPNMAFLARYPDPKAYINENLQAMGSGTDGGIIQQAPPGATVIPKKQP